MVAAAKRFSDSQILPLPLMARSSELVEPAYALETLLLDTPKYFD